MRRGVRMRRVDRGERPRIRLVLVLYGAVGIGAAAMPAPPPPVPVVVAVPPAPRPTVRPEILTEITGAGHDRVVALTFDDGPDPTWTPQVLRLLREHGAVATFCMVGGRAVEYPELVAEVAAAGMRLCDHTRTHDMQLATRTPARIVDEIAGARADLLAAADVPVDFFRAPAGNWAPNLVQCAVEHGMQPLGWSVDPRDWTEPGVAAIVQEQVHPGAVVLLHDGGAGRGQTVAALEQLLPWLTAQGYRFDFPAS